MDCLFIIDPEVSELHSRLVLISVLDGLSNEALGVVPRLTQRYKVGLDALIFYEGRYNFAVVLHASLPALAVSQLELSVVRHDIHTLLAVYKSFTIIQQVMLC